MPIRRGRLADIQAQQVEVGRIRLGTSATKTSRAGKEYNEPVKLETFRLTSRSRELVEEAASLYGGDCEPWQPQSGGAQQWQVLTEQRSISVIVPPEPVSQYYEVWSGGKCQRRCDGVRELINDTPCPCGPDPGQRRCKPTTRLSLMLADMSGIGVWRLETHGYYAAAELPAVADLLSAAGGNVPARLEMEERSAMIPDPRDPTKEVQTRFMVPVLHVQRTPAQLVQILGAPPLTALPGAPDRPALPAAAEPQALPAGTPPDDTGTDPEQERIRQEWAIHTHFEDRIAQATTPADLAAVGNAIRQSGLSARFIDSLRLKWGDRQASLNGQQAQQPTPTPERVPQPPPAANAPQVDRGALMMQIQTLAGSQGMTLTALRAAYVQFSNGADWAQASPQDLESFHAHLQGASQ